MIFQMCDVLEKAELQRQLKSSRLLGEEGGRDVGEV